MRTFKGIMESGVFRAIAIVIVALAVLVLIFGIAAGCSSSKNSTGYNNGEGNPGGGPGANEVWIQGNAFSPGSRTVSVGATVTWTNKDAIAHTVTSGTPGSPSGAFDSGNLGSGGTFSHTFSTAGSFPYFCRIHNGMRGTITVQ